MGARLLHWSGCPLRRPDRTRYLGSCSWTDKPGCGDTLGDWRQQSIVDRARTTVAALEAMRAVEEVDADRVGLWGASQGGWVVPLAAAADHRVAFAILVSAAAVSPFEQEAASLEQRMRLGGAPADEIEVAPSAFWELVHQLRAFEPPEDVVASLSSDDPRYQYFHAELISEPEPISFFSLIGDHDPLPPLQSMRCPVLLIWGELDPHIPVDRSRRAFLEQFESADNRDITVATFPGANHWILVERPEPGSHGKTRFAPGYIETMTDWAKAQTDFV